jgi:membrane fusion protein, heavy metal efflux system
VVEQLRESRRNQELAMRNEQPARPARGFGIPAVLTVTFVLTGCGGANQASKMTSFSAGGNAAGQAELFSLPADQISHIQVVQVKQAPFERTLRLTGAVEYNGFNTTPVITQVGGPVSRVVVAPGEHVTANQPMLYVNSPDYSLLRSTYLKSRDALHLAQMQYARAQDLYAHHAIAQADLETAESTQTQAQADFDSSADAIRVLGISDPESIVGRPVSAELPLLAPLAGEVVERLCSPGQLLQAGGTQCFTLSDMSSVWILVNVYQDDLASVHVGQEVSIENEPYPGVVRGKIEYLAPELDPTTRTLQARIESPNPGERLKKEMYVTAVVNAGVIPNALSVPDAAVLRDAQNMPYVYVQTGGNQFSRQAVTLGESRDGNTLITSGLQAGERLVGDGALFLQFQNSLQR